MILGVRAEEKSLESIADAADGDQSTDGRRVESNRAERLAQRESPRPSEHLRRVHEVMVALETVLASAGPIR